jgi:hypothetical protein
MHNERHFPFVIQDEYVHAKGEVLFAQQTWTVPLRDDKGEVPSFSNLLLVWDIFWD